MRGETQPMVIPVGRRGPAGTDHWKDSYPCSTRPSSSFSTKSVPKSAQPGSSTSANEWRRTAVPTAYELRDVPHHQWGSVKSYPVAALRRAANLHYFGDAIPPFAVDTSVPKPTVRPEIAVRLLMGNLDGQAKATLWNILYRRALGCGAGEYRTRAGITPESGALWKQLEPPLVRWFESCLAWIAANHHTFSSLDECFGGAAEITLCPVQCKPSRNRLSLRISPRTNWNSSPNSIGARTSPLMISRTPPRSRKWHNRSRSPPDDESPPDKSTGCSSRRRKTWKSLPATTSRFTPRRG